MFKNVKLLKKGSLLGIGEAEPFHASVERHSTVVIDKDTIPLWS